MKVQTQEPPRPHLEVKTKSGITWILFEGDSEYQQLLRKIADGQEVFENWELFPELRIPTANDLLGEAAIIEQAWWESGDYSMLRAWFDKMMEYEAVALTIPIEKLRDLSRRINKAVLEADFDRMGRLIMLKGLLFYVIRTKENDKTANTN